MFEGFDYKDGSYCYFARVTKNIDDEGYHKNEIEIQALPFTTDYNSEQKLTLNSEEGKMWVPYLSDLVGVSSKEKEQGYGLHFLPEVDSIVVVLAIQNGFSANAQHIIIGSFWNDEIIPPQLDNFGYKYKTLDENGNDKDSEYSVKNLNAEQRSNLVFYKSKSGLTIIDDGENGQLGIFKKDKNNKDENDQYIMLDEGGNLNINLDRVHIKTNKFTLNAIKELKILNEQGPINLISKSNMNIASDQGQIMIQGKNEVNVQAEKIYMNKGQENANPGAMLDVKIPDPPKVPEQPQVKIEQNPYDIICVFVFTVRTTLINPDSPIDIQKNVGVSNLFLGAKTFTHNFDPVNSANNDKDEEVEFDYLGQINNMLNQGYSIDNGAKNEIVEDNNKITVAYDVKYQEVKDLNSFKSFGLYECDFDKDGKFKGKFNWLKSGGKSKYFSFEVERTVTINTQEEAVEPVYLTIHTLDGSNNAFNGWASDDPDSPYCYNIFPAYSNEIRLEGKKGITTFRQLLERPNTISEDLLKSKTFQTSSEFIYKCLLGRQNVIDSIFDEYIINKLSDTGYAFPQTVIPSTYINEFQGTNTYTKFPTETNEPLFMFTISPELTIGKSNDKNNVSKFSDLSFGKSYTKENVAQFINLHFKKTSEIQANDEMLQPLAGDCIINLDDVIGEDTDIYLRYNVVVYLSITLSNRLYIGNYTDKIFYTKGALSAPGPQFNDDRVRLDGVEVNGFNNGVIGNISKFGIRIADIVVDNINDNNEVIQSIFKDNIWMPLVAYPMDLMNILFGSNGYNFNFNIGPNDVGGVINTLESFAKSFNGIFDKSKGHLFIPRTEYNNNSGIWSTVANNLPTGGEYETIILNYIKKAFALAEGDLAWFNEPFVVPFDNVTEQDTNRNFVFCRLLNDYNNNANVIPSAINMGIEQVIEYGNNNEKKRYFSGDRVDLKIWFPASAAANVNQLYDTLNQWIQGGIDQIIESKFLSIGDENQKIKEYYSKAAELIYKAYSRMVYSYCFVPVYSRLPKANLILGGGILENILNVHAKRVDDRNNNREIENPSVDYIANNIMDVGKRNLNQSCVVNNMRLINVNNPELQNIVNDINNDPDNFYDIAEGFFPNANANPVNVNANPANANAIPANAIPIS